MIPILKERSYENNVISFKTVGFLTDAHNCQVTEERNGIFEMSFSYPVEGLLFDYLREDLIVEAKPNDTDNIQKFRIYEITKPINGIVTVNCEHISYELRNYPVKNAALHSITPHVMIQGLIDLAKNNVSAQNSNINLYTARSSGRSVTSSLDLPLATVRSALGGTEGSVLDLFGGEYKFDNFDIYLPTERGSDKGVIVAYRKNLTDVKLTTSMESSYTGLFPYTLKDDVYTFLSSTQYPTGSISVTNNSGIAERILMRDFSSEFENDEEITPAALLTKAQAFLNKNDINALTASMSVSFVNLWQSEEYKDYAPLEKVGLCDIVTVYHEKLGINLKLKVIKTVYDPVSERYIKIELGSPKSDFAATIAQQQKQVDEAVKIARSTGYSQITAEYQQAIADATEKITGNSGGHVHFALNAAGEPEEITVMDTDDTSTATKCWRWNLNGFGYSSSGYSGKYTTAITSDGEINADFIRTGTMSAERIRTGLLSSANGYTYFDLTNSVIKTIGSYGTEGQTDYREFQTYFRGGDIEFYGSVSNGALGKTAKMRTGYQMSGGTTTKHFALGYISNDNSHPTDGSSSLKLGAFATSDDHFIDLLELSGSRGAVFGTSSNKIKGTNYCRIPQGGHVETNVLKTNGELVGASNFSSGLVHYSAHSVSGNTGWRKNIFGAYNDSNNNHWTGWAARDASDNFLHSFTALKNGDLVYFRVDNGSTGYISVDTNNKRVALRQSYGGNFSYSNGLDLYCKDIFCNDLTVNGSNVYTNLTNLWSDKTNISITGTSTFSGETHYETLVRHNDRLSEFWTMLKSTDGRIKVGLYEPAMSGEHYSTLLSLQNGSAYYGTIACSSVSNFAFYKGSSTTSLANIYAANINSGSTEESKKNISSASTNALSLLESSVIYNFDYLDGTEEESGDDEIVETVTPISIGDNGSSEGDVSESGTGEEEEEETLGSNLGFVIGRETPDEVISEDGTAVNLYSFTSLTWLACQQLLDRIKVLKARVDELENPTS